MRFAFGRVLAGVAVSAACAVSSASAATGQGLGQGPGQGPGGQGPGGGPAGRFGQPFGSGNSIVRVGPGAFRPDPGAGARGDVREPSSLHDALFGRRSGAARTMGGPAPGRYAADLGRSFVLDREGRDGALVRFGDSPEIWALTAAPGPRGDVIFKNDVGDPILRATRMGGLTLFSSDRPEGEAAAQVGVGVTLRPPASIGPQALIQALAQASARASRAAQHLVAFEAPDVTASTDWVFADAAWVASEGFVRAAARAAGGGRTVVARVLAVRFTSGRAPAVAAQGTVLQITVAPDRGPAGRPSSQRVAMSLGAR